MKNKRKALLSAKLHSKENYLSVQKDSFESSPNKLPNHIKHKNLSLTINNNNKEKTSGFRSPISKTNSNRFIRSLSNNNIYPSLTKNFANKSNKNIYSDMCDNSGKFSSFSRALTYKGLVKSPSTINNRKINRYLKLENEKLSQEIYYLTRDINKKNKKLILLGWENKKKDRILTEKENEINDIINKNKYNIGNDDDIGFEKENFFKTHNIKSNINNNNMKFNYDIIFNNKELNNSNYNNLFIRIKYQILKTFKEIKEKDEEIKNSKKLKIHSKMKELSIETILLQEQIDKINILINNAINIYNKNQEELKELQNLEDNVYLQQNILEKLNKDYNSMVLEEYNLNMNIKKMENIIERKNIKKFENKKLINTLAQKQQNLSKEKIFKESYNQLEMKNHIKKLKKLINVFKFNYKASTEKISGLKEQQNNFFNKKNQKSHYINKNNIIMNSFGSKNTSAYKNFENLYKIYESKRNYENLLKNKFRNFRKKLEEITKNNNNSYNTNKKWNYLENDDDINEAINFGIKEDNPYFSKEEDNIPINTNKFNNFQFGNFAYILFKNFESKNILLNESQTKIINPLLNAIDKKGIKKIKYKNESFNFIVDELTEIMMKVLENTNERNKKLITIFLGALLHNSNYDISKFIYSINVLFSYTKNYITEEELFIYKFQTKYKDKLTLLYNKLYEYIKSNNINQEKENHIYIPLLKMKEIIEENNIKFKEKYLEFLYFYMKKFNDSQSNIDDLDFSRLNNLFFAETKTNEKISTTSNNYNNSVTEITNEEYEKYLKETINLIKKGIKNLEVDFEEFVKDITNSTEVDGKEYNYFTIENFNEKLRKSEIELSEIQLSCLCNKYSLPDNLKYIDKNKIEKDVVE